MAKQKRLYLKDEHGKIYFGWYIVLLGFIITTFSYTALITTTGVFLVPVTSELGFGFGDFSMYIMIMSFASMAYLFLFTRFMTEQHLKKLMIISGSASALGMIGFAFSTQLWQFYLLAVLLGFGFSCMGVTPTAVLVSNWFGTKAKGFALGCALLGPSIGGMFLVYVLNLIVQHFGWHVGYLATAGGILFFSIPCTLLFFCWSPEKKGIRRMGEDLNNLAEVNKGGIPFREARRNPKLWLVMISGSLVTFSSSSILQHTQTYFTLCGYSTDFGAMIVSLCTGLLALGCICAGWVTDRAGLHLTAPLCAILFALCFFSQAMVPMHFIFIIMMVILYGFGTASVNEITPLLPHFMFGEKYLPQFVSCANIFLCLGGSFGATVVGKIYDATGSYQTAWWLMGGVLLLAAVIRFYCTLSKNKFSEVKE